MSYRGFDPFPVFEPGRSTALAVACGVLGLTAVGALFVAQIPWWTKPVGMAIVVYTTRRTLDPGPGRPVLLRRLGDGRWSMDHADGRTVIGELHRSCVAHPWLCVVVLADGWRRAPVTIPADALSDDAHRRLRVWLRWCPTASARPAAPWSRRLPLPD